MAIESASEKAPSDPKKVERLEQNYTPQVKRFINRCLDDDEHKYSNAGAWPKGQKIPQPDKDQMREIISDLVWNINMERAIARHGRGGRGEVAGCQWPPPPNPPPASGGTSSGESPQWMHTGDRGSGIED